MTIFYGLSGNFCKFYILIEHFCYSKKIKIKDNEFNKEVMGQWSNNYQAKHMYVQLVFSQCETNRIGGKLPF